MDNNTAGTTTDIFSEMTEEVTPTTEPACDTFVLEQAFVFIYLYPLIGIVLLMSFFKKRRNLWPNVLWGRPGILYPVNFIDEFERRWMYAAVLVLLAHKVLFLFEGQFYFNPSYPSYLSFIKVFIVLLNVVLLCLEFYPLLACIVVRRYIVANILGLALVIPWIFALSTAYVTCPPTEQDESALSPFVALYDVPQFLSFLVLVVGYIYDFALNIKKWRNSRKTLQSENTFETQEELCMLYIRTLMLRKPVPKPTTKLGKLKAVVRYTRMKGFRYPPRVLCTVVIGLYALFRTAIYACGISWELTQMLKNFIIELEPSLEVIHVNNKTQLVELVLIYVDTIQGTVLASFIFSFVVQCCLMLHFISQYRIHIRKFFGGNHSWHHKYNASPNSVVLAGLRYSGYQVAFLIYGYVIMSLVLFVFIMLIAGFIVIPLTTHTEYFIPRFFIEKIKSLWPAILVGLALNFGQLFAAKFLFLQDRGAYVALTNRRLYHVISYFIFFFNIVIGLFSCLKRLLLSVIFGTLVISRLDRCLLIRGFERFDSGFVLYLGMLTVDVYHNHPVVKGFVHILKEEAEASRQAAAQLSTVKIDGGVNINLQVSAKECDSIDSVENEKKRQILNKKHVRNKFWKMLTLMHNPSLVLERMQSDIAEVKKKQSSGYMEAVTDAVIGAGIVFLGKDAQNAVTAF